MPELKPTEGRLREKLAYSTASESSAARQNDAAVNVEPLRGRLCGGDPSCGSVDDAVEVVAQTTEKNNNAHLCGTWAFTASGTCCLRGDRMF